MAKLAIGWPFGRKFVSAVIIGVRSVRQLEANLEAGDWNLPRDLWNELEARTRPAEEYMSWFGKFNYARFFETAEFHDESVELP